MLKYVSTWVGTPAASADTYRREAFACKSTAHHEWRFAYQQKVRDVPNFVIRNPAVHVPSFGIQEAQVLTALMGMTGKPTAKPAKSRTVRKNTCLREPVWPIPTSAPG